MLTYWLVNQVDVHQARLVLGWVTIYPRQTQPGQPSVSMCDIHHVM